MAIYTFGEIMLRLSPLSREDRLVAACNFLVEPGGSESNVAIALSHLGNQCEFITVLPKYSHLSDKVISYLRSHNVGVSQTIFKSGRLGTYWTENGIGQRNSFVLYDRQYSSFATVKKSDFKLQGFAKEASWFHVSGITPAVSKEAAETLTTILNRLKNVPVSIDLNFRSKLWRWASTNSQQTIHEYYSKICAKATLIVANEEDFHHGLGYPQPKTLNDYSKITEKLFKRFKKLRFIAVSLRGSVSASENNWQGLFFHRSNPKISCYSSPVYNLTDIVDRFGAGDSFAAGIIHGLINKYQLQETVNFACALSTLKHTIRGDACTFGLDNVNHLIRSKGCGRVVR